MEHDNADHGASGKDRIGQGERAKLGGARQRHFARSKRD